MGHIGEKSIFGYVGKPGMVQGILHNFFLLHFVLDFLVYPAAAHYYLGNVLLVPYIHNTELEILCLPVSQDPEIYIIGISVGKGGPYILGVCNLLHEFLVFGANPVFDVI